MYSKILLLLTGVSALSQGNTGTGGTLVDSCGFYCSYSSVCAASQEKSTCFNFKCNNILFVIGAQGNPNSVCSTSSNGCVVTENRIFPIPCGPLPLTTTTTTTTTPCPTQVHTTPCPTSRPKKSCQDYCNETPNCQRSRCKHGVCQGLFGNPDSGCLCYGRQCDCPGLEPLRCGH